jgi:hypothetical protein
MMEELIQRAEGSNNGLQILQYRFFAFGEDIHILLPKRVTSQGKEIEAFVGCPIPREVIIYPPPLTKSNMWVRASESNLPKSQLPFEEECNNHKCILE